MKTDIITIDNKGNGMEAAQAQVTMAAQARGLNEKETLQLNILTEELMGLARSVTGELTASFWIESEEKRFSLHLGTRTQMDARKRYQLLSSATTGRNEAAKGFIGYLRDKLENAILSGDDGIYYDSSNRMLDEAPEDNEWDRYERSILRRFADEIKIGVKGGLVEIEVVKTFA